jgi:DtxR family Mn-dependent transcriptional regulator
MSEMHAETMLEEHNRQELSHSLEDYLEAIVDLAGAQAHQVRAVDVANKLSVSKASVSKAISNLRDKGYVVQPYYGDITLTDKGLAVGRAIWHKHRLLFKFINEAVGVDAKTANYEACQIEHAISDESFKKWESYLKGQGITVE